MLSTVHGKTMHMLFAIACCKILIHVKVDKSLLWEQIVSNVSDRLGEHPTDFIA